MDEMRLVREFFPEPVPPAPDIVERAYARMTNQTSRVGSLGNTGRQWWERPHVRTVLLATATALSTLAIVIALAVTLGPGTPRVSSPGKGRPLPPMIPTARAVLLVAARHVPSAAATGRYWRVQTRYYTIMAGGTSAHPYNLLYAASHDEWYPRDTRQRYWDIGQVLGVRPLSTADLSAWRAAGAPRSWRVSPAKSPDAVLHITPSQPTYSSLPASQMPTSATSNLPGVTTYAQFRAVPTTVTGLMAYLKHLVGHLTTAQQRNPQELTVWDAAMFLLNDPVSAQVRAAAFGVLAELPGTKLIGRSVDPLGYLTYELLHPAAGGRATEIFVDPLHGRLTALNYVTPPPAGGAPSRIYWVRCTKHGIRASLAVASNKLPSLLRSGCELLLRPLYGRPYHGLPVPMTYWVSSGWTNASPPVPSLHARS